MTQFKPHIYSLQGLQSWGVWFTNIQWHMTNWTHTMLIKQLNRS